MDKTCSEPVTISGFDRCPRCAQLSVERLSALYGKADMDEYARAVEDERKKMANSSLTFSHTFTAVFHCDGKVKLEYAAQCRQCGLDLSWSSIIDQA